MSEKKIELEPWFEKQDSFKKEVTRAKEALEVAEQKLAEFDVEAKKLLIVQLGNGFSTGNILTDEIIEIFGLDKNVIKKFLSFNDRLIKAQGQEMLIVFPYRHRIRFGGPGDTRESDWQNCKGYIFGVLSGESLEFVKMGKNILDVQIALPFERYLSWGFWNDDSVSDLRPLYGPKVLDNFSLVSLNKPSAMPVIGKILGFENMEVSVFIGSEVDQQKYLEPFLEITNIRKALHAATPEEQVAGSNI
jgi:hypothetical protein